MPISIEMNTASVNVVARMAICSNMAIDRKNGDVGTNGVFQRRKYFEVGIGLLKIEDLLSLVGYWCAVSEFFDDR